MSGQAFDKIWIERPGETKSKFYNKDQKRRSFMKLGCCTTIGNYRQVYEMGYDYICLLYTSNLQYRSNEPALYSSGKR